MFFLIWRYEDGHKEASCKPEKLSPHLLKPSCVTFVFSITTSLLILNRRETDNKTCLLFDHDCFGTSTNVHEFVLVMG